jgi:hypothetical protein
LIGPVLHLGAAPTAAAAIPNLFRSDEVRAIIEHPPVTRDDGFNILTYERANIVEGDRFVIKAWRKRLELYKDGTFVGLGTFVELLGWPRDEQAFGSNPKVNSLALVEFTYDFFKTYDAILDHVEPKPIPIRCQIGIRGAHSLDSPLWMAPYALNSIGYDHPRARNNAPDDAVVAREVEVEAQPDKPHINPGAVAYELIESIYNWFGLASDMIPYTSAEALEIDPATFLREGV